MKLPMQGFLSECKNWLVIFVVVITWEGTELKDPSQPPPFSMTLKLLI